MLRDLDRVKDLRSTKVKEFDVVAVPWDPDLVGDKREWDTDRLLRSETVPEVVSVKKDVKVSVLVSGPWVRVGLSERVFAFLEADGESVREPAVAVSDLDTVADSPRCDSEAEVSGVAEPDTDADGEVVPGERDTEEVPIAD